MRGTSLSELPQAVALIAVVAIVGGLGAVIVDDMKTSISSGTTTVNTTLDDGVTGIGELTSWLDIIALVVAATIILALVLRIMRII